jgi:transcriptional regulator with XRE-family HTH domain
MAVAPAEIIRRRRGELGLTQEQLAERIGRAASTVRRWERGEAAPPKSLITTLAGALQVSPRDLAVAFGESGDEEAESGAAGAAPRVESPGRRKATATPDPKTATPDQRTSAATGPAVAAPAAARADRRSAAAGAGPPDAATEAPSGAENVEDGEQPTVAALPIDEQATVATPTAVAPGAVATAVAAPPQQPKRRSPLLRAPALNPAEGLSYLESPRQRLRYWLRTALTIVAGLILLMILVWAFGELKDALDAVWELFGEDAPPVTSPGAEF